MDEHVNDFFCQYSEESNKGNFHKVIALHDAADVSWEVIFKLDPNMPKGWYELAQLPSATRIQFIHEFWLSKIPYHPDLNDALEAFFGALDDIGIFLTQQKFEDPFKAHMVYSLAGNKGFYRGFVNASEEEIVELQKFFPSYILPKDYLTFLGIHNGFCKAADCTGITCVKKMGMKYGEFQNLLMNKGQVMTKRGRMVDPATLIPFYESFGMPYYQCFWGEWHPELEMGNVYYSSADNTISDPLLKGSETMAFSTFTDWLIFYLEQIEV